MWQKIILLLEGLVSLFNKFFSKREREEIKEDGANSLLVEQSQKRDFLYGLAEEIRFDFDINPDLAFLLAPEERSEDFADRLQDIQADLSNQRRSGESYHQPNAPDYKKLDCTQCRLGKALFEKELAEADRPLKSFFVHCSDSDRSEHDNIDAIRSWHLARGFSDIGYHFIITKDGLLHKGRSIKEIPAAQRGYNTGGIAVCLTGSSHFTNEQMATLRSLIDVALNFGLAIKAHNEVNPHKTCPNFDVHKLYA